MQFLLSWTSGLYGLITTQHGLVSSLAVLGWTQLTACDTCAPSLSCIPALPAFVVCLLCHLKVSCSLHALHVLPLQFHFHKPWDHHTDPWLTFIKTNTSPQIISSSYASVSLFLKQIYLIRTRVMAFCSILSIHPFFFLTSLLLISLLVSRQVSSREDSDFLWPQTHLSIGIPRVSCMAPISCRAFSEDDISLRVKALLLTLIHSQLKKTQGTFSFIIGVVL